MGLQQLATDLGNAFVAFCVALAFAAWLWTRMSRLLAFTFGACFVAAAAATTGLKLVSHELLGAVSDTPILALSKGAPSGHAALASVVYGSAAMVFLNASRRPVGLLGYAWCVLVIGLVAVTRVTLVRHTAGDVIAGLVVGGLGAFVFRRALRWQGPARPILTGDLLLAMVVVATLALASGVRLSSTHFI